MATVSGKHSWVEQQILEANPILEAFGNAKTVRNDNSSRFGKYIDIHFNENGAIEGAKIEQYLLEKSRIVSQNQGERNYHIFYSLLAGLSKEEKKKWDLAEVSTYNYLNGGKTLKCDGRNESNEFNSIRGAMKVLNFSDIEINDIFQLLAAILHLGNLKYKSTTQNNMEAVEINDSALAIRISNLFGVEKQQLTNALTRKTIFAHGEKVVSPISKNQANDIKDAFVKSVYGKMFVMIVNKINEAIYKVKDGKKISIGVLDIFGFENFDVNSFEQLCINYANENLQQFFVKHIFKLEQSYYESEGISWKHIEFIDNQEVLDMIGIKPLNIMALIDDESKFPKGSDSSMLEKLHGQHSKNPFYLKLKSDKTQKFGIQHFAGTVFYEVTGNFNIFYLELNWKPVVDNLYFVGFLEKNRDTFSYDVRQLVQNNQNKFLYNLFQEEFSNVKETKKTATIASQFRSSVDLLMKTLDSCHPFFVRCIKPNDLKKPGVSKLVTDR